ncbi:hypothetical protein [Janthinobacterium sp. CG_23.3]|uniref:hypothetical protein n=1 Tax=Janthinobacterium sp. CG_23.3 TaxID=3349634 RepID=UPI0038D4F162
MASSRRPASIRRASTMPWLHPSFAMPGPCGEAIWPADGFVPDVDADECRLHNAAPTGCGGALDVGLAMGAVAALQAIGAMLQGDRGFGGGAVKPNA